jgi:hypothetical protein
MKLLIPRPRGGSVWACLGSFGGGFVAGDETSLDVRLGADARCFLTTQASTKIYRNPRLRPCGHTLRAELTTGSLVLLPCNPSPARPTPSGRSFICNPAPALFCWIGFVPAAPPAGSAGLSRACKAATKFFSARRGCCWIRCCWIKPTARSTALSHGPLQLPGAARHDGPLVAEAATAMLAEVGATLPVTRRAELIVSASPIRQGAVLRIAGERRGSHREVRRRLAFVAELLGDDPWARKW